MYDFGEKLFSLEVLTVIVVVLGSIARRMDVIIVTRALWILPIGGRNLELLGADLCDPALYIAFSGISHPHQLGVLQHFFHCNTGKPNF